LTSLTKFSERDICTKFITPALVKAGWDVDSQVFEEVSFTDGRIIVRGKLVTRGPRKRADYVLYHGSTPVAIIEAKDQTHSVRSGIQQALDYADILDIPNVFSSNGEGFLYHDRTANASGIETELSLNEFPSPTVLWGKYKHYKGIALKTVRDGKRVTTNKLLLIGRLKQLPKASKGYWWLWRQVPGRLKQLLKKYIACGRPG
jgi:type I restriction enzyme R subunit